MERMYQVCLLLLAAVIGVVTTQYSPSGNSIRLCVARGHEPDCQRMQRDISQIRCIYGRDRLECMQLVRKGEADIVRLDPDEVYIAGKNYGLSPVANEEVNRSWYQYRVAAVVQRGSQIQSIRDLKGKKSCHSGFGDPAGWNVPIGTLLAQGVMEADCRGELYSVKRFFGESCAPGKWSPDPLLDTTLKKEARQLCMSCSDTSRCDERDNYAGNQGALKCLAERRGDVAFTTVEAMQEYQRANPQLANSMDYLCLNGSVVSTLQPYPCSWAEYPTNAFVASSNADRVTLSRALTQIFLSANSLNPPWFYNTFVSGSNVTNILSVQNNRQNWPSYLGNYESAIVKDLKNCEPKSIKFCTSSQLEQRKCQDMSVAATGKRIYPSISCVAGGSHDDCIEQVQNRRADIVVLDAGDIYRAGRRYNLKPIAAEQYGQTMAASYAVAVVKRDSFIRSIQDLRGARSCHPSIDSTVGWIIPIGKLLEEGQLRSGACNRPREVATYFSASCVPGANDTRYNPGLSGSKILCDLCAGDESGRHKCAIDDGERYSGNFGAFRCLVEGNGEVAFVTHETPINLTDDRSRLPWTRGLRSDEFQLLCPRRGLQSIQNYHDCNWAEIPAEHVMISQTASPEVTLDAVQMLAQLAAVFGPRTETFLLFGLYDNTSDVLFKDSTTSLKPVPIGTTYDNVLGQNFLHAIQSVEPELCTNTVNDDAPVGALLSPLLALISLFVLSNAIL